MFLNINQEKMGFFRIKHNDHIQAITAKQYFIEYAKKMNAEPRIEASFLVCFEVSDMLSDDGFSITLKDKTLSFVGGKRGVIYAVFTFLEKIGFRFFTPELETYPEKDICLSDFYLEECSPFVFRDVLSIGATDKEWSLKQKLNSDLWNTRAFTPADGGGYDFAGIPAHSLTGEYLLKPYVDSHPEYFSLKNGVRITDRMGQICMTNDEAINAAAMEVIKLIEENPDKNMVSVSQGDNHNFCECERCQSAIREKGLMGTYFDVVNTIAKKVKEKYPNILIHTLAYEKLCQDIDFVLEDNVMLQYCHGVCHTHAIEDVNCSVNIETVKKISSLAKKSKNLYVWNYTNCFKYELFEYPFIHHFLTDIRFFAKCGVKGVFNEGMHRECADFATAYELRSYLLAKVMWNPYMSEREFYEHMEEFCEAFYGLGYKWIIEYLLLYRDMQGECASYDAIFPTVEGGTHNTSKPVRIVSKEKTSEFLNKAYMLLNSALEIADNEQVLRIEKLKTCVLYYELFWTMNEILERGTEEEKSVVKAKNQELIQRIIAQDLVITFWGQTKTQQNEELKTKGDVPPSEWNYKW